MRCLTSDELSSGLLPTVWESTRRLIRRQVVSQFWSLDKWRGYHFAKISPEYIWQGTLEDIAPTLDFLHAPGAISVHGGLWSATSLEPGPSGLKSNTLPTRLTRPQYLFRTGLFDCFLALEVLTFSVGPVFLVSVGHLLYIFLSDQSFSLLLLFKLGTAAWPIFFYFTVSSGLLPNRSVLLLLDAYTWIPSLGPAILMVIGFVQREID